jgi:hypothetical protein
MRRSIPILAVGRRASCLLKVVNQPGETPGCPTGWKPVLRILFNRRADFIAPFGPGTIVIADVPEA